MDNLTPAERSERMSRVRSKNTKPEMIVRKYLHSRGLRFRVNENSLPGSPDIKLTKYKTVVFVHGCFWHGHAGCTIYRMPKTRMEFWSAKIEANARRDANAQDKLVSLGWRVLIVWECEVKNKGREIRLAALYREIIN